MTRTGGRAEEREISAVSGRVGTYNHLLTAVLEQSVHETVMLFLKPDVKTTTTKKLGILLFTVCFD